MAYRTAKRRLGYEIAIRPMAEADLDQLHQLSIGVGWPHRPEDWRLVIGLGHGIVACDAIGRVLGSAMWWPFGERFATVGMVITSPRLQAQGAGRELMDMIFAQSGTRDLRLSATKAGYRLYRSLGFEPVGRIFQHQGRTVALPAPAAAMPGVRPVVSTDLEALARLDASAYGADRSHVIAALLAHSVGTVVERNGEIAGFSLCRPFGRGHVVGPIVAEDDDMAVALVAPHVEAHQGSFLRVDTAQEQGRFGAFLESCGMTIFDSVTPMIRGNNHGASGAARTFGLINQALG
ncbi:GNAT family N-acetyltransferase [Bosea sp. (in: a-proteobacteria)]|uniref:GNAT family N-acetyltransferase n=1 Tax=Bosea sp. (in: a-proteobacteria) TaxID=1871050 RepID=UPI0027359824|nr:GNAT family N-acetyltransferase [Bosea sp. (in: a-proteobacteria)]MDP3410791.1 GNAT family N-acetyltransferase [Bosea sp. (in: a-proteobacteria)]